MSTIEFSLVEVSVLHGLQQGNKVLKEIQKEMNIEAVEKLLDETAEAQAVQRVCLHSLPIHPRMLMRLQEIDEMLANNLSAEDEDAVQAELRQLQQEAVCSFSLVSIFS